MKSDGGNVGDEGSGEGEDGGPAVGESGADGGGVDDGCGVGCGAAVGDDCGVGCGTLTAQDGNQVDLALHHMSPSPQ